jgi:hypothetical protein
MTPFERPTTEKRRATPPKVDERLLGHVERDLELVGDGDRREAVEDVVRARHASP